MRHHVGPDHFMIRHGVIHLTFPPPDVDSATSATFRISANNFLFSDLFAINRDSAATALHLHYS